MVRLSYHPIKSELHRVQSFVNYIMLEVILKAPKLKRKHFSTSMVIPRYKRLIDGVNKAYLLNPLKVMYDGCRNLHPYQLKVLRKAVYNNNRIEDLCEGRLKPVHYSELEDALGEENHVMMDAIKKFCYELYDNCLRRKPFKDEYEDIGQYYKRMVTRDSDCVMCGYEHAINIELDHAMSAFDHYLPRALYPFNSVNMDNLVPTCETCNETYKGAKDPLYVGPPYKRKMQRRCFFPFSVILYDIDIDVRFLKPYRQSLPIEDIVVKLGCNDNQGKVDNWDRIYNIKNRYRSYIGSNDSFKFYLSIMHDALFFNTTLNRMIRLREQNMDADMNFLRVPFLKAVLDSMVLNGSADKE